MALTTSEEALVRQLLDQQAAILSLAGNEATITSKLGATKVTLADLVAASSVADADLLLTRQGTTDKSVRADILAAYMTSDLGVTPPQFDNDTSLATTAFVQRALGNFQQGVVLSGSQVLVSSDAGKVFSLNTHASLITLPLFNSVPSGSKISFVNVGSTNAVIQRSGTDLLFGPSGVGGASFSSALTSYTLLPGDSCEFTACSQWEITAGTCLLQSASSFAASKSGNGYQKFPSGLIIQWGTVSIPANSVATVTFPIAFQNAGLVGYASRYDAAANGTQYRWDCGAPAQTQMNIANNWTETIGGSWFVIGY